MSQKSETLQLLTDRLTQLQETIDLVVLIDGLSFIALTELLNSIEQLKESLSEWKTSFAGGFLELLKNKIKRKVTAHSISQKIKSQFIPELQSQI